MAVGVDYKLIAVIIILGILASSVESVGTLRLCGRELADALALVCQGRGYNVAFMPQGDFRGTRYKRGIVDECCRRGCTLKTLESYCSEARPTKKDTLQISKRSELSSSEIQTKAQAEKKQEEKPHLDNFIRHSKSKRLRPLILLISSKSGASNAHVANMDITALKSKKNNLNKPLNTKDRELDDVFLNSGYNMKNEPLDTDEIMAEVVESSLEITNRAKRNVEVVPEKVAREKSFYIARMLSLNNQQ